jgi:hypothetical protein
LGAQPTERVLRVRQAAVLHREQRLLQRLLLAERPHLVPDGAQHSAHAVTGDRPSGKRHNAGLQRARQIAESLERGTGSIDDVTEGLHQRPKGALRALPDADEEGVEGPTQPLKVTGQVVR